jgi:hypothetical protein
MDDLFDHRIEFTAARAASHIAGSGTSTLGAGITGLCFSHEIVLDAARLIAALRQRHDCMEYLFGFLLLNFSANDFFGNCC